ncbi:MAG: hypothetical protein CR982_06165 [Candidatus Cloacimonadota bacterium]|nr:MAG: hypothetical protein CR982_06165 [Candidatus Cloacimonadota bacterium]PIE78105.1 MAG: hypothetical protein CSA15_09725 [Candidatus Delongbacteria bacterium]
MKNYTDAIKYWNRDSAREEMIREEKFPLVDIQTTIAWIKINKYLKKGGISTILDAGAGVGRYSLPLAKTGYKVTHLDISKDMNLVAMKTAENEDVKNIDFLISDISRMTYIADKSYDLVISFDSPITYCYPDHYKALSEVLRASKDLVMIMVSSRTGTIPFYIDFDVERGYRDPKDNSPITFTATESIINNGVEIWENDIKEYLEREGKDAPKDYSFEIDELTEYIKNSGYEILEIGGLGALARSIKPENLEIIRSDERLFNKFITYSLDFDFNKHNIGMGAVNTMVIAKRKG